MTDSADDKVPEPTSDQRPDPTVVDQDDTQSDSVTWSDVEAELFSQTPTGDRASQPQMLDPSLPLVMVETAFLASAASLVFLVNYYFPIGPLLRLFFSIPISLTYLR